MARAKAIALGEKLVFLLLVIFPFGQLIRISVLRPIDLIAGLAIPLVLFSRLPRPRTRVFQAFFVSLLFSFTLALTFFNVSQLVSGGLYFLRVVAYYFLFILVWSLVKSRRLSRELILNALLLEAVAVGIFGWYQYFRYPDLTSLKFLGWDDHLYRLVSTFLDPGFTGIVLVLGFLIALALFIKKRSKVLALTLGFLLVTTAFTYARSAYLALLAGTLALLYFQKKIRRFVFILGALFLIAIFLPRPSSEGVQLERLRSVYARISNYGEAITLIKKSPLFGFGYNNICVAKNKFLGVTNQDSHACSGFDASILVLLSATGIIGFILFGYLVFVIWTHSSADLSGVIFKSSLVAVFVHSLFANSLFYPWVLAWMGLLLALSFKE